MVSRLLNNGGWHGPPPGGMDRAVGRAERTCVCWVLGKYRGVVLRGREAGRAPLWVTGKRVSGLDGWADGLESAVLQPSLHDYQDVQWESE